MLLAKSHLPRRCLALALLLAGTSADLRCDVLSGKSTADYDLSAEASDGIGYPVGQNEDSLRVLDCSCDPRDVRRYDEPRLQSQ